MRSELSRAELELRVIYALVVAGKSARFANTVIERLFPPETREAPFEYLRSLGAAERLEAELRIARTGRYLTLEAAICWLVHSDLDLAEANPEQLEACPGIGPKTARFFVLWTRPDEAFAALDVHVLRWLRSQGYDAPNSTPSGKRYRELERAFLDEARRAGVSPRELDLAIWEAASTAPNETSAHREEEPCES